jgi:hypothetical protein
MYQCDVLFDTSDLHAITALNLAGTLGKAVARTTTTSTCASPMVINGLEAFAEICRWPAIHMAPRISSFKTWEEQYKCLQGARISHC